MPIPNRTTYFCSSETHTWMNTVTLFLIALNGKQFKWPTTEECMRNYGIFMQWITVQLPATKWMNPITRWKEARHKRMHTIWFHLCEISKIHKTNLWVRTQDSSRLMTEGGTQGLLGCWCYTVSLPGGWLHWFQKFIFVWLITHWQFVYFVCILFFNKKFSVKKLKYLKHCAGCSVGRQKVLWLLDC